ncbi:MAG: hypothetical protein J0H42_05050 [Rhizobiales bacterium]|nr:hypothetical protein [Hyphomicrobiales bacterium]
MNANQNNQNTEAAVSDADLDQVAGGFFSYFFANIRAKAGGSSGMNDPSQRFQAILDQLTR